MRLIHAVSLAVVLTVGMGCEPLHAAEKVPSFGWEEELGWKIRMNRGPRYLWGDLEAAQMMLKRAKASETVRQRYAVAYAVLAANPGATFTDLSESAAFQKICAETDTVLLGTPLLGDVTSDGVRIWVRTLGAAEVEVVIDDKTYGPVRSSAESDLSAVVAVTGLKPDTRYEYQLLVNGTPAGEKAAFTTAPATNAKGVWRIQFGGDFHRRGMTQKPLLDQMLSRDPLALVLLGDLVVSDRFNHRGFHRADYYLRDSFPDWQQLAARTPVYAGWDDHDYLDNDLGGLPKGVTPRQREEVWEVFRHSWVNPAYGFPDERRGLFFRTRIGPADLIMTDNKYFREPLDSDQPSKLLGREQFEWLLHEIEQCEGPFIILSSGTMWTDHVSNGKDSWGQFAPEDRERLFALIETKKIAGVLLISADRHGACGYRIPRANGFSLFEFGCGALGGITGKNAKAAKAPAADGLLLYRYGTGYAFGEFELDTSGKEPQVTCRIIQDDGTVIYEKVLTHSELTPLT